MFKLILIKKTMRGKIIICIMLSFFTINHKLSADQENIVLPIKSIHKSKIMNIKQGISFFELNISTYLNNTILLNIINCCC